MTWSESDEEALRVVVLDPCFTRVEPDPLREDAMRYRKLRSLALQGGDLEAFVALEQLDHLRTNEEFDAAVDDPVTFRERNP